MDYRPEDGLHEGKLTDGIPGQGVTPSTDAAALQNAIIDELLAIQVAGNVTKDKTVFNQVTTAILNLLAGTGTSDTSASASRKGVVKLINALTSASATDALTAAQGKVLKGLIDGKLGVANLLNVLTSTSASDALTAAQGKVLKDLIDSISRKNYIINGNFDIWQRGVSFTADGYSADRWYSSKGTGGAMTVSRQTFTVGQTDVPGEPAYYLRHDQTTGGTGTVGVSQRIESVRAFAGKSVTVSFYAKASSAITLAVWHQQNFGSGGSASVNSSSTNKTITTAWQKFTVTVPVASITGKTIGAASFLAVWFQLPSSTVVTLDIAQVQVEKGPVVSDFEFRSVGDELALCQRYYEIVPSGHYGSLMPDGSNTGVLGGSYSFLVEKRAVPAVGSWTIQHINGGQNSTGRTVLVVSTVGFSGVNYAALHQFTGSYVFHNVTPITVDAEL